MGTYNLTKGDAAVSCMDFGRFFCVKIPIVVTDIIAANATLTTNEKITASDVIALWDIPAGTVLLVSMASFLIVTPGTASNTANIGIAGSTEMFSGTALDSAANTLTQIAHNASWGTDNYGAYTFAATDTIDMVFVADEVIGEFALYIPGYITG